QQANTAFLRALVENRRLGKLPLRPATPADQLINRWHAKPSSLALRAKSVETNKFTPPPVPVKGGSRKVEARLPHDALTAQTKAVPSPSLVRQASLHREIRLIAGRQKAACRRSRSRKSPVEREYPPVPCCHQ